MRRDRTHARVTGRSSHGAHVPTAPTPRRISPALRRVKTLLDALTADDSPGGRRLTNEERVFLAGQIPELRDEILTLDGEAPSVSSLPPAPPATVKPSTPDGRVRRPPTDAVVMEPPTPSQPFPRRQELPPLPTAPTPSAPAGSAPVRVPPAPGSLGHTSPGTDPTPTRPVPPAAPAIPTTRPIGGGGTGAIDVQPRQGGGSTNPETLARFNALTDIAPTLTVPIDPSGKDATIAETAFGADPPPAYILVVVHAEDWSANAQTGTGEPRIRWSTEPELFAQYLTRFRDELASPLADAGAPMSICVGPDWIRAAHGRMQDVERLLADGHRLFLHCRGGFRSYVAAYEEMVALVGVENAHRVASGVSKFQLLDFPREWIVQGLADIEGDAVEGGHEPLSTAASLGLAGISRVGKDWTDLVGQGPVLLLTGSGSTSFVASRTREALAGKPGIPVWRAGEAIPGVERVLGLPHHVQVDFQSRHGISPMDDAALLVKVLREAKAAGFGMVTIEEMAQRWRVAGERPVRVVTDRYPAGSRHISGG